MKFILTILILISTVVTVKSQNLTRNFTGTITYADYYSNAFIRFDTCGDLLGKEIWTFNNGNISIVSYEPMDSIGYKYLTFKFFKQDNSIFLTFIDPKNNKRDTVEQFRISKDTISSFENFRLDSNNNYVGTYSSTTYLKDTSLTIFDQNFDCYIFEKYSYWRKSNPGPSHLRELLYIDKNSNILLQEDVLVFYLNHRCRPTDKWQLARQLKIKKINKNGG